MSKQGILSNELVDSLSEKLDGMVNAGLLEPFDGPLIKAGIRFVDNNFLSKIPDENQDEVIQAIEGFVEGDMGKVTDAASDLITEVVGSGVKDVISVALKANNSNGGGPSEPRP